MHIPESTNIPNPLLTGGRIPGQTFQIPSAGLFYNDGELDDSVSNGEVHVYPMTSYDEILIKTPDLLLSGQAIDAVFKRCIPQVKQPLRLLAKDVDFLLICLRSVAFGASVTVLHEHKCDPIKCAEPREHKYDVSINTFIEQAKCIDATVLGSEYTVTLADGKIAHLRPMRYDALIEMMTDPGKQLSPDELHEIMTGQLAGMITKVVVPEQTAGNISELVVVDSANIHEWVKSLAVPDVRTINGVVENMAEWGADTEFKVECADCEAPISITTPLNPMSFFT